MTRYNGTEFEGLMSTCLSAAHIQLVTNGVSNFSEDTTTPVSKKTNMSSSDNPGDSMRMDLSMPHSASPEGHSSDTERHRPPILPSEDVIKPSHQSDAVASRLSPEKQL